MVPTNAYTHDTFYVTKIKYILYNVQDKNALYNNAAHPVICGIGILLASYHFTNRLSTPLSIEVLVPSQEIEQACI
jgi:hypothetical protein